MYDLEPWKIWAVTGALVALIIVGTAARVRPQSGAAEIAQASVLAPDQRTDSSAAGSPSGTDLCDAYSYSFSQVYVSRGAIQDIILHSPYSVSVGNSGYVNISQDPKLDIARQIFDDETHVSFGDAPVSTVNIASDVFSWLPTDTQATTAMADDATVAWTYPVTTDDAIELGWPTGVYTASIDDSIMIDTADSLMLVDSPGSNSTPALYSSDHTALGRMMLGLQIQQEELPRLVELSEAGVDTYSTEALDEIRTKVIVAAVQQQVLDQVKAAQEEQVAFQQASAAYSNTIEQSYEDLSRIPW